MDTVADHSQPAKVQARAKPADYKAGQVIAEAGGVLLGDMNPIKVTATVTEPGATTVCQTQLTAGPDGLGWRCTCHTASDVFCRHLVATALVARSNVLNQRTRK